jgi:hypothetical protein
MKTAQILLWDEIDHNAYTWPTPEALPKEYITPPPTLASIPDMDFIPLHMRKYLRSRRMYC